MDLSLIIPLKNEAESLPELEAWIRRVCEREAYAYEIWFVDDGSNDGSWKVIESLQQANTSVRGIKFRRNYGKSAALQTAFEVAQGDVVITMDADLQDSPDEIPELYRMIKQDGYDLVSGWKQKRYDPLSKTIPTKLYNAATRWISGIPLHDFNCGLKSYRSEVIKSVEVYGDMHRYIPVLAKWAGFTNIGEKVVEHRARKYGTTKFGLERFINGPLDLMSVSFVGRFGKRPMHLFGTLGILSFLIGFAILVYLSLAKIAYKEVGIADRPLFYFGILALIVGTQLFLTGFLAEMINRNSPTRNVYLIEKEI
ncbi:MAG TPA: glycosyltransferase family 2 protein [Saprospiraceae bacterium]|nr:glycosyltransferase family 2 protein [Saprospiraceae bacterium]HPI05477.1 glycosyltransferase family 2 protein [Saprospiraceae bacterium]